MTRFEYVCYTNWLADRAEFAAVKNPASIEAFGVHLKTLWEEQDLSQQTLAKYADVAKLTVQRIEHVNRAATLDILVSLACALRFPLRGLMDFAEVTVVE